MDTKKTFLEVFNDMRFWNLSIPTARQFEKYCDGKIELLPFIYVLWGLHGKLIDAVRLYAYIYECPLFVAHDNINAFREMSDQEKHDFFLRNGLSKEQLNGIEIVEGGYNC